MENLKKKEMELSDFLKREEELKSMLKSQQERPAITISEPKKYKEPAKKEYRPITNEEFDDIKSLYPQLESGHKLFFLNYNNDFYINLGGKKKLKMNTENVLRLLNKS
jgi:hypothetical protein